MISVDNSTYSKLELISNQVQKQLRKRGVAIAVQNDDGSIQVGKYLIEKQDDYYIILDYQRQIIADKINLPQTAALLANDLALGKFLDMNLLNDDRNYGYAEFEEALHGQLARRNLKKDIIQAEMLFTKSIIKKQKKEVLKKQIVKRYEKLLSSYK